MSVLTLADAPASSTEDGGVPASYALVHHASWLPNAKRRVLAYLPDEITAAYALTHLVEDGTRENDRITIEPSDHAWGVPHCPSSATDTDGTEHSVIGCGSSRLRYDGEMYDCYACGIFFEPAAADFRQDLSALR